MTEYGIRDKTAIVGVGNSKYARHSPDVSPVVLVAHALRNALDDAGLERSDIDVDVRNRWFGKLFGYRGSFTVEERHCTRDQIPVDVLPVREERRELRRMRGARFRRSS